MLQLSYKDVTFEEKGVEIMGKVVRIKNILNKSQIEDMEKLNRLANEIDCLVFIGYFVDFREEDEKDYEDESGMSCLLGRPFYYLAENKSLVDEENDIILNNYCFSREDLLLKMIKKKEDNR